MTYKELVKGMTTKELKEEQKSLKCLIDEVECFNTKDLILREYVEAELERRKK